MSILLCSAFLFYVTICRLDETILATGYRTLSQFGTPPSPRHSAIFVIKRNASSQSNPTSPPLFYLFGGIDTKNNYYTNVLNFDPTVGWRPIEVNGIQKTPQRVNCARYTNNGSFYFWGGMGPDGYYSDLWRYDMTRKEWMEETQSDERPSARTLPHYASNDDYLFIFGGRDNSQRQNDLWRMEKATGIWKQIHIDDGDYPPTNRSSGQAYATQDYIYIFGGDPKNSTYNTATVWKAKINNLEPETDPKWESVNLTFTPRFDAGYAVSGQKVYVYGGLHNDGSGAVDVPNILVIDFTHAEDASPSITCKEIGTGETHPSLAAVVVADVPDAEGNLTPTLFSFGGLAGSKLNGDLYSYNLSMDEPPTVVVSSAVSNIPTPRSHHSALAALGKMWVFGGIGTEADQGTLASSSSASAAAQNTYLNDLVSFDFITNEWQVPETAGSLKPSVRAYTTFVEHSARLFVFGGLGMNPLSGQVELLNDLWYYSILQGMWKQITPKPEADGTTIQPRPRYNAAAVVLHKIIYIFGGRLEDNSVTNELWKFSLVTRKWTLCTYKNYEMNGKKQSPSPSSPSPSFDPSSIPTNNSSPSAALLSLLSSLYPDNTPSDLLNTWRGAHTCTFDPATAPLPRGGLSILTQTFTDATQTSRDAIVIAGGYTENHDCILDSDILVLPLEDSAESENGIVYFKTVKIEGLTKPPILGDSATVSTEHGFLSVGGVEHNDAKDGVRFLNFTDLFNPSYQSQTTSFSEAPLSCGSSAVYFGRTEFIFGGDILSQKLAAETQFQNQFFILQTNASLFTCSPGTFVPTHSPEESREAAGRGSVLLLGRSNPSQPFRQPPSEYYRKFSPYLTFDFNPRSKLAQILMERLHTNEDLSSYLLPFTPQAAPAGIDDGCSPCNPGTFTKSFDSTTTISCNKGSYNKYYGAYSGYHCIPCSAGQYNDQTGQTQCQDCDADDYCPVGSAYKNATKAVLIEARDKQPDLRSTKDNWSLYIMLICYGAGIVIGLTMAFVCVCCPTRVYLYKIDLFSDSHANNLDPITNSAPKILRKSRTGGFVSLVYLSFAICAAVPIIVDFIINNVTEQKSVISKVMDQDLNLNYVNVGSFTTEVTLIDFSGSCTKDDAHSQDYDECSSTLEYSLVNIKGIDPRSGKPFDLKPLCKAEQTHNIFVEPSLDCKVRFTSSNATLSLPDENPVAEIRLGSTEDNAMSYAVRAVVEVDTGIGYDEHEARVSRKELLCLPPSLDPLKGTDPTVFKYWLMGSLFTNTHEQRTTGFQLVEWEMITGSTAKPDAKFVNYGMNVLISLEGDPSVVKTNWVLRQQVPTVLASTMSTMMGFMGIFGAAVGILEMLSRIQLPCGMKVKDRLFGKLSESSDNLIQTELERKELYTPIT